MIIDLGEGVLDNIEISENDDALTLA